jgi:hypothetical protein
MYWQSGGQPVNRREFITLTGASVAWPFAAMAQEPGRTYRLGVLFAGSRSGDVVSAFFDGVRSQGFIEGQNLTVIYHALGMNSDLLPEWVAELVKAASMSSQLPGIRQFAPHRGRLRQFRSLQLQTMWSGRV